MAWLPDGGSEFDVILQIARRSGIEIDCETPGVARKLLSEQAEGFADLPPAELPMLAMRER